MTQAEQLAQFEGLRPLLFAYRILSSVSEAEERGSGDLASLGGIGYQARLRQGVLVRRGHSGVDQRARLCQGPPREVRRAVFAPVYWIDRSQSDREACA